MGEQEREPWRPRKRLRTLAGVQARGLAAPQRDGAGRAAYFALWSHLKASRGQHEARCLYVSERVPLAHALEWLPLDMTGSAAPPELLHGLASGLLHLHVYAVPCGAGGEQRAPALGGPGHPSPETLQARAAPPRPSPLHADPAAAEEQVDQASDAGREEYFSGDEALEGASDTASQPEGASPRAAAGAEAEPDAAHFVSFKKFFPPKPEVAWEYLLCRGKAGGCPADALGEVTDHSLCREVDLPGELLLAASLDLEQLDSLGSDARLLDAAPPGPRLLLQLAGGQLCVWPSLPPGLAPAEPAPAAGAAAAQKDGAAAAAAAPDAADARSGGWSIFRRASLAPAAPELLGKEATSDSLAGGEAGRPLRERLAAGVVAEPPGKAQQASLGQLQQRVRQLAELQAARHEAAARGRRALRSLELALRTREAAKSQRARLEQLAAAAAAARARAAGSLRRAKAARGSAGAARELLRAQAGRLGRALQGLEALWAQLEGPEAEAAHMERTEWRALHARLVARRCRLAADLQRIFGVQPRAVSVVEAPEHGFLWQQLDRGWAAVPVAAAARVQPRRPLALAEHAEAASSRAGSVAGDSESGLAHTLSGLSVTGSQIREMARLSIGALDLEPSLWRQKSGNLAALSWDSETEEELKAAAALGYAAHLTAALSRFLAVPLKYPLRPANSRSAVRERQAPLRLPAGSAEEPPEPVPEYGLWPDGGEATRFSYAIFLLNKDLEQLLAVHGLASAGPSHVLQNLFKLLSAAASVVAPRPPGH